MYINFFSFDNKFINLIKGVYQMKKITVAILIFLFGLFLFVDKKNHHDKNNFIETEATEFDGYEKISEFATEFNTKSFGRAENIKLSAKKINGKEILPGETFSYNKTVGPTNKKNGYKKAQIFIKGKKSKGYGGGSCQVSSTLYNAVLKANLKVTERHPHSLEVKYVEQDKDAATSYGGKDFKFVNDRDYKIKINSYVYENKIVVALYKV